MERCRGCELKLPPEAFYAAPWRLSGLTAYCKVCARAKSRAKRRRARGLDVDVVLPVGKPPAPDGSVRLHKGYVEEKRAGLHRAYERGWVPQHVLVMEALCGFPVTRAFTVHHRNGIKDDNRPANLELRVGNHGTGADLLDALLARPELQAEAIRILHGHGWQITGVPGMRAE